jgi:hypothetical protein
MMADRVLEIVSIAKKLYQFEANPALLNYISKPPTDVPASKTQHIIQESF